MSQLKFPINYKSLEMELQEALKEDELYKLQNEAKIRAVEQNVPTYEDFRQMVNAACLKPLKRADIESKTKGFCNPIVDANNLNITESVEFTKESSNKKKRNADAEDELANTYEQFVRVWETIVGDERKFNYLKRSRNILREKIFRTEIPPILFAGLIRVCSKAVAVADNIADIVNILSILSKCNRFPLAVFFMSKDQIEMCTKLFHDLLAKIGNDNVLGDEIKLLKSSYAIKGNNES